MTVPELTATYRDAYSRINAMVIVGEGLADRHFRLLADALPDDRQELERLAAMEGRQARGLMARLLGRVAVGESAHERTGLSPRVPSRG